MNWISVGLAALCGALAALIASLFVRNPKEKRIAYTVVLVVAFAVLQGLSREFIFPDLNAWNEARKVEAALLDVPAYQAIKEYDPKTYDSLLSNMKQSIKKGVDESQIIGIMRGHMIGVVEKRLPHASDEATVSYINVMLTEMSELKNQGDDLCYRFLFPQQAAPLDMQKYVSKQTLKADLSALAQVIKSSAENPQPIPQEVDVMPQLKSIYLELAQEYGNDIAMLEHPAAPDIDRAKVCTMISGLYTRILQLPKDESGKILRFMLSKS
jgi:hypothetical protein